MMISVSLLQLIQKNLFKMISVYQVCIDIFFFAKADEMLVLRI